MNQKWNLQDIRPAEPRRRRVLNTSPIHPIGEPVSPTPQLEREEIPNIVIEDGTKKGNHRIVWAAVLFLVIVGSALGLSALLGKTELTVYPLHREPNVNSEFTAYPDKRDGSLSYEILTLEEQQESQVKASGQIDVETKTTGTLEITKTTPGAERIIPNTRFRSGDGKVFRIGDAVVVPGAVKDSSGTLVPGSIQATVTADQPGEEFNLPAGTTFDVPGFQEGGLDDLYSAIKATNKTAFAGGFKGPQFKIDEGELATARQALQMKLRDKLLERIEKEKPSGFITFPGATAITYSQLPAVEYGNDLVTIKEQAILQVPLFKASDFGAYLAKEAVATYSGGPVRVDDPAVLTFAYKGATTSSSVLANEPSLTFTLKGKPKLIWEYDAEKLTKDLAGLQKTAINNAISAYPGIEGAKVSITPFWRRSFPEDSANIIVVEELKDSSE